MQKAESHEKDCQRKKVNFWLDSVFRDPKSTSDPSDFISPSSSVIKWCLARDHIKQPPLQLAVTLGLSFHQ